jgi:hypothetical protein
MVEDRVLAIKHAQDDGFNEVVFEENASVLQLKGFLRGHRVLLRGTGDSWGQQSTRPL